MSDSTYQIYTFLSREDVERLRGIPPQAIVGLVDTRALREGSASITPDTFRPNRVFREFLQEVLSECVFRAEGIRAQAEQLVDGHVYVIDRRTQDPGGDVPMHDIVCAVEARDGALVPGSFWPNPDHRIVSDRGLFALPGELQACLLEAMRNLPPVPTANGP